MADLNDLTTNVNIWNDAKTKAVTVTTDGSKERLDVSVDNVTIVPEVRVSEPIHEYDGWDNSSPKISYTVPTGKVLYITGWNIAALSDAAGHTFALKYGSTEISWASSNNDGTTTILRQYPDNNPFGPISAGTVVTVARINGSSNEQWSAELDGYLEVA